MLAWPFSAHHVPLPPPLPSPLPPPAWSLRRYQQEGINWLAFLQRFHLHGILADDMGLGKTLQSSAIIASDTAVRLSLARSKGSVTNLPPSLVVCPATLVAHWAYEVGDVQLGVEACIVCPL